MNQRIDVYMENPHTAETRKTEVSKQLQYLRKKTGLTQKEVCQFIKVTPQTYSGYEKGKYEPTMETIVRLSLLYGVSTDLILCNWLNKEEETETLINNIIDNPAFDKENLWSLVLALKEDVDKLKNKVDVKP